MPDAQDMSALPASFSGKVRLFPLPNLVMFPHVMQPLHIFEPRYRELLADALAGDQLIAMALLAPGWEGNYEGRPPLQPVACLTRITTCQAEPDGKSNILVLGLRRVGLLRELPPERAFREAQVEVYDDTYPATSAADRAKLTRDLVAAFKRLVPALAGNLEPLEQMLAGPLPLGTLTDIIGYTLDLEVPLKHRLLAERSVDARARLLLEQLAGGAAGTRPNFPPEFSSN